MTKKSYSEWVRSREGYIGEVAARYGLFIGAFGLNLAVFAFNPIAGVAAGVALFGGNAAAQEAFNQKLKEEYQQYLDSDEDT